MRWEPTHFYCFHCEAKYLLAEATGHLVSEHPDCPSCQLEQTLLERIIARDENVRFFLVKTRQGELLEVPTTWASGAQGT